MTELIDAALDGMKFDKTAFKCQLCNKIANDPRICSSHDQKKVFCNTCKRQWNQQIWNAQAQPENK